MVYRARPWHPLRRALLSDSKTVQFLKGARIRCPQHPSTRSTPYPHLARCSLIVAAHPTFNTSRFCTSSFIARTGLGHGPLTQGRGAPADQPQVPKYVKFLSSRTYLYFALRSMFPASHLAYTIVMVSASSWLWLSGSSFIS